MDELGDQIVDFDTTEGTTDEADSTSIATSDGLLPPEKPIEAPTIDTINLPDPPNPFEMPTDFIVNNQNTAKSIEEISSLILVDYENEVFYNLNVLNKPKVDKKPSIEDLKLSDLVDFADFENFPLYERLASDDYSSTDPELLSDKEEDLDLIMHEAEIEYTAYTSDFLSDSGLVG